MEVKNIKIMRKGDNSNVVVIATLTAIFHVKNSKRKYEDKATYGFVMSSFTSEDKKQMTEIIKQDMDKILKKCYGEALEKGYLKIEYRVTYRTREVDFIIGQKDE